MLTLATALTACSPLGILDTLFASNKGFEAERGIPYRKGSPLELDAYRPLAPMQGHSRADRPLVIFFYGGGWRDGARANYRFVGQALSQYGIATVIPDYRKYPEAGFPGFIEDAAYAMRWAHDNARRLGADPKRIVLAGHSAGAYIAAMLALDPRYLDTIGLHPADIEAVVGLAGPYGFNPLAYKRTRPIFANAAGHIDSARPVALAENGLGANADLPRFALLHGRDDKTVSPRNTVELARVLKARGVVAPVTFYDGIGHYRILLAIFSTFANWAPVREDLAAAAIGDPSIRAGK